MTKLASITDGTSNTIMFAEHTRLIENSGDQNCWHWWTSGNYGDTIFTTFWPINPQKKVPYGDADATGPSNVVVAASSNHPGGANVAPLRRLGPVHQRNDRLLAKYSDDPGSPCRNDHVAQGDVPSGSPFWPLGPGTRVGVWQKLGTRNGGEVVSSDSY